MVVFNFLNVPLDVPFGTEDVLRKVAKVPQGSKMVSSRLNTKTTRASQSTQSTWLKHALMAQRSLIKGYEPRRKIYGVFCFIDSFSRSMNSYKKRPITGRNSA